MIVRHKTSCLGILVFVVFFNYKITAHNTFFFFLNTEIFTLVAIRKLFFDLAMHFSLGSETRERAHKSKSSSVWFWWERSFETEALLGWVPEKKERAFGDDYDAAAAPAKAPKPWLLLQRYTTAMLVVVVVRVLCRKLVYHCQPSWASAQVLWKLH